jgi:hypothetical protein
MSSLYNLSSIVTMYHIFQGIDYIFYYLECCLLTL